MLIKWANVFLYEESKSEVRHQDQQNSVLLSGRILCEFSNAKCNQLVLIQWYSFTFSNPTKFVAVDSQYKIIRQL